jgi:hypothetical protein
MKIIIKTNEYKHPTVFKFKSTAKFPMWSKEQIKLILHGYINQGTGYSYDSKEEAEQKAQADLLDLYNKEFASKQTIKTVEVEND